MRALNRRTALVLAMALLGAAGAVVPNVASADATYGETVGGTSNTWSDYNTAGGTAGPQIGVYTTVQIACKLPGFRVADQNTWWYRIASSPWNYAYYVSADAFYNNGATSGTLVGTPWVDPAVPDCSGSSGGSSASPAITLAKGPATTSGAYHYAISLSGFPANSSVRLTCYDSASPAGFYIFSLPTNGSGSASTQSYCYSGDGPDHWVIAADRIESNHVAWSSGSSGSSPADPSPPPTNPPPSSPETCDIVQGVTGPTSGVSKWLFGRFEGGYSSPVVIPWKYFSGNPQFVEEAQSIPVGGSVVGWRAVFPSDMYFALGHFTIMHTSPHCYRIYDLYDFSELELPFWLQQKLRSAVPFDVRSSGRL